jgi:hypothetical protein
MRARYLAILCALCAMFCTYRCWGVIIKDCFECQGVGCTSGTILVDLDDGNATGCSVTGGACTGTCSTCTGSSAIGWCKSKKDSECNLLNNQTIKCGTQTNYTGCTGTAKPCTCNTSGTGTPTTTDCVMAQCS